MKKLLSILVVCVGCGLCHGALIDRTDVLAVAGTVSAEKYPDANSVLVSDYTVNVYKPDGTSVSTNEWYEKILTEAGRRSSRTASFWLNLTYGELEIETAELIKPNGSNVVIDVDANSRIMTEQGQMGANIYDPNTKTMTLAFPGIEIGDVIHLNVVRTTTKARVPNTYSDYLVFESTLPVLEMVSETIAPKKLPLVSIRERDEIGEGISYTSEVLENGDTRHVWRAQNVAQSFPEPGMPPLYTCSQRVLLSTMKSWEDLSRWYSTLCEKRMSSTTPEMQRVVDELVKGVETRDEKIWKIFTYVSQKIRYMGVMAEAEAPGYEPHEVSLTFEKKHGVCRDKAALLAAMLRMAEIEAFPVIIHAGEQRDPDVPQQFFNHAITAVTSEIEGATGADKYILMDPTNENAARLLPEYLCEKSFIVATPEGETLLTSPALPAKENRLEIETTGAYSNGWLVATSELALNGINDTVYRGGFSRMRKEDARRYIERQLQAVAPGAQLTDLTVAPENLQDTSVPMKLSFSYIAPNAVAVDAVSVGTVPRLSAVFGYINFLNIPTGLKERRFPLETEIPCGVEEQITLTTDFDDDDFVGAVDFQINRGGVHYAQQVVHKNGVLSMNTTFEMLKSLYTPADYLEVRDVLQKTERTQRAIPIWENDEIETTRGRVETLPLVQSKDVRVLLDETTVEPLNTTNAWMMTQRIKKQILTYAGKMREADLRLNYNPTSSSVELLDARVMQWDKEGQTNIVHTVSELEQNVMDQGWVASAPRYTAGKTLVVNLPGVEVGSVIDVTVRRKMFGGAVQAYEKRFGGFDDCDEQTVIVKPGPNGILFAEQRLLGNMDGLFLKHRGGVMTLTATNLVGVLREDNMPPLHLVFSDGIRLGSGMAAWDYAKLIENAMLEKVRHCPDSATKARALVVGKTSVEEQVKAIRDFVVMNVRNIPVSSDKFPLESYSSPDVTLADGYGHMIDVAIVYRAMLDAVGIKSEFRFIDADRVAGKREDSEVYSRGMFDGVLVVVKDGDDTFFVNEGSQYAELRSTGLSGVEYLDIKAKRWRKLHHQVGWGTANSTVFNVDLASDGSAEIEVIQAYAGESVEAFRKRYEEITPEDRRRHVLEVVSSYSRNAELVGEYVTDTKSYPGLVRFRMRIPNWAVESGDYMSVRLPGAGGAQLQPRYSTRQMDFFRTSQGVMSYIWNIKFPKGMQEVQFMPEAFEFSEVDGTLFSLQSSVVQKDGRLVVKVVRGTNFNRSLMMPEQYEAYMNAALKTQGRGSDTIIAK